MKKFLSVLLTGVMAVSLAACGGAASSASGSASGNASGASGAAAAVSSNASGNASADASGDASADAGYDFTNKTIGVQLGTTGDIYASDLETDGTNATVERYNKGADAVQALVDGKVDCVIIDENPAEKFVEANPDKLAIYPQAFAEESYAICMAKDNDELTEKFNEALKELKEDGTVDQIINNYIGDDAGKTPYESPSDVDTSNGELHMATNAAFEPYEYYDSNNNIVGIDVDLAQAICDKLGYKLVIDDMEFDSIIPAVQSGKDDFGMAGMTVTPDREQNVNFTDTYTTTKQDIIIKK